MKKLISSLVLYAELVSAQSLYPVVSLPPYLRIGSNLYIPADNMSLATLPSLGSWTTLGTVAPIVTTQTNGSVTLTSSGGAAVFLAAPTQTTSIEAVVQFSQSTGTAAEVGIWFYDSTNSKIYIEFIGGQSGGVLYQLVTYTYSGTGTPSFSSNGSQMAVGFLGHLKMSVSGSTLTSSYSKDGGVTFIPCGTVSVGTISKIGLFEYSGNSQIYSVVVN